MNSKEERGTLNLQSLAPELACTKDLTGCQENSETSVQDIVDNLIAMSYLVLSQTNNIIYDS
jgi:hypothetical protein